MMAAGPDQSNELSVHVLDSDDGCVSSQDIWRLTVQLEYFDCVVLG